MNLTGLEAPAPTQVIRNFLVAAFVTFHVRQTTLCYLDRVLAKLSNFPVR